MKKISSDLAAASLLGNEIMRFGHFRECVSYYIDILYTHFR
jgi:hypothetical protein